MVSFLIICNYNNLTENWCTSKRGLVEKSKMIKSSSNNDLGRNLDSQSFLHRTYGVNKSYWPLSFEQLWIQRNWD